MYDILKNSIVKLRGTCRDKFTRYFEIYDTYGEEVFNSLFCLAGSKLQCRVNHVLYCFNYSTD